MKDKNLVKVESLLGILDDESIKHKGLDFDIVIPINEQSMVKDTPFDKEIDGSIEE